MRESIPDMRTTATGALSSGVSSPQTSATTESQRMAVAFSFIVIGRNQLATIGPCLDSVFAAARNKGFTSFEVIYVDSKSTDGSAEWVRERYTDAVRLVHLCGEMNAGIARNVGAALASGEILFFIDGDMEIEAGFLGEALDVRQRLVHPVITGQLPERLYDSKGQFLGDAPDRYRVLARGFGVELGGVFLIDSALFASVGGFCPELRVTEDLDLGLRLASRGVRVLRIPHPIATHHTVEYFDLARLASMFRDGSLFYPGALFRRHLTNRSYLPILLSHQRPTMVLVLSVILAITVHPAWIIPYLAYIAAKNLRRPRVSFLQDLIGTSARGICFLLGLAFFYPRPILASKIDFVASER